MICLVIFLMEALASLLTPPPQKGLHRPAITRRDFQPILLWGCHPTCACLVSAPYHSSDLPPLPTMSLSDINPLGALRPPHIWPATRLGQSVKQFCLHVLRGVWHEQPLPQQVTLDSVTDERIEHEWADFWREAVCVERTPLHLFWREQLYETAGPPPDGNLPVCWVERWQPDDVTHFYRFMSAATARWSRVGVFATPFSHFPTPDVYLVASDPRATPMEVTPRTCWNQLLLRARDEVHRLTRRQQHRSQWLNDYPSKPFESNSAFWELEAPEAGWKMDIQHQNDQFQPDSIPAPLSPIYAPTSPVPNAPTSPTFHHPTSPGFHPSLSPVYTPDE